jgi:hypothetical protein
VQDERTGPDQQGITQQEGPFADFGGFRNRHGRRLAEGAPGRQGFSGLFKTASPGQKAQSLVFIVFKGEATTKP